MFRKQILLLATVLLLSACNTAQTPPADSTSATSKPVESTTEAVTTNHSVRILRLYCYTLKTGS